MKLCEAATAIRGPHGLLCETVTAIRGPAGFQNQSVMWTHPDVAGWLEERGGSLINVWKRRFFVLQSSFLFYFRDNKDIASAHPVGVIPIEGSSLEVADEDSEGRLQRKWCIKVKLGPQFAKAKFDTYMLAAPSMQALEGWLDKLTTASSTHETLLGQLRKCRRIGCEVRAKLYGSPKHAKMLEDARGPEAEALQEELARVRREVVTIHEETLVATALAEKHEADAMRALALWSLLTQYLSGDANANAATTERLKAELELTQKLIDLLQSKAIYLQGHKIEDVCYIL